MKRTREEAENDAASKKPRTDTNEQVVQALQSITERLAKLEQSPPPQPPTDGAFKTKFDGLIQQATPPSKKRLGAKLDSLTKSKIDNFIKASKISETKKTEASKLAKEFVTRSPSYQNSKPMTRRLKLTKS